MQQVESAEAVGRMMRTTPDFAAPVWSVMIPAYNPDENLFRQALESVLQQDEGGAAMQIEVLDDCSPNGPVEGLVRKIAGERVAVYREDKNLGLAGIWNRCIERAKGEYVHILHQDDIVYPGFYRAIQEGLEENPFAGAALCRHAYINEKGGELYLSELESEKPALLPEPLSKIVDRPTVQCAAIVVKRETYAKIGGYDGRLTHALDWEMWMRIANSFPIWYEPKVLASWRQHDEATTPRQILEGENTRDIAKAIDIWSKYVPRSSSRTLEARARRRFATEALKLAEYLMRQGHRDGFEKQLSSAFQCDPSIATWLRGFFLRLKFLIRPLIRRQKLSPPSQ